jgi:3-methyladenine DNA glycosylase AlkD
MTAAEVMAQLEKLGTEQTRKTYLRHGVKEPFFGVKIGDLKVLQKKIKKDHALALALYDTGNSDAMYLAGLISDPQQMTKAQIQKWLKGAHWYMPAQYTVPWVAAESKFGAELARDWIDSPKELTAIAGWFTWSSLVGITPDEDLDLDELADLLDRVQTKIHKAKNREKYAMNSFIIAVGGYVEPLLPKAKAVAKAIGTVEVDHGDTSCKTPNALDYLTYMETKKAIGKKRKTAMC